MMPYFNLYPVYAFRDIYTYRFIYNRLYYVYSLSHRIYCDILSTYPDKLSVYPYIPSKYSKNQNITTLLFLLPLLERERESIDEHFF